MKPEDGRPGMRIVSRSDGFTNGWRGSILEVLVLGHPSPDAFYVQWDNGTSSAVACAFVVEVVDGFIEGPCPFCHQHGGIVRVEWDVMIAAHSIPLCDAFDRMTADEFIDAVVDGKHRT